MLDEDGEPMSLEDLTDNICPSTLHHTHEDAFPCLYQGYSEVVPCAHVWRCSAEGCTYSVIRLCNRFVDWQEPCTCGLEGAIPVPPPGFQDEPELAGEDHPWSGGMWRRRC